ncbi:MAG: NAD(P)(+) transhydrogenase (Re/Si-specific) subunit beta, partial [Hyphomicrobiales bacterium]|nr:NAD(P)(+) transhydrogenase (Re/Si-specific) subunit beta [Hyphomicrobiales bacterium]
MSSSIVTVAYIGATILFVLSLGGLSNPETAKRGNWYGITGMAIAVIATVFGWRVFGNGEIPIVVGAGFVFIMLAMVIGGAVGLYAARTVQMTQMPELVAIMHSLVGFAACAIGFASYIDTSTVFATHAEHTIHLVEIYIGILIGAVTFTGSVIAFGKLSGRIDGKPLLLPARHWINLAGLILVVIFGKFFLGAETIAGGMFPLIVMTLISLAFGVHMVMAIGGADMPVVISMLNSYSGWAAAATGFMLSNDLLIVVGALVGSSGAILSYIMCRAMNRNFISVIAGGFGTTSTSSSSAAAAPAGDVKSISAAETADMLSEAKSVIIVPGYG